MAFRAFARRFRTPKIRNGRWQCLLTCGEECGFEIIDLSSEELVAVIRAAEPR